MTAPIASTSWQAGQPQTINWKDDGTSPSLQDFGTASVAIYVGNAIQQVSPSLLGKMRLETDLFFQTMLQSVVDSVDVSTTASITFTPDPSIGPNGDF